MFQTHVCLEITSCPHPSRRARFGRRRMSLRDMAPSGVPKEISCLGRGCFVRRASWRGRHPMAGGDISQSDAPEQPTRPTGSKNLVVYLIPCRCIPSQKDKESPPRCFGYWPRHHCRRSGPAPLPLARPQKSTQVSACVLDALDKVRARKKHCTTTTIPPAFVLAPRCTMKRNT